MSLNLPGFKQEEETQLHSQSLPINCVLVKYAKAMSEQLAVVEVIREHIFPKEGSFL